VNQYDWNQKHKQFDAALDADQAEFQAMLSGTANMDAAIGIEKMAGVIDDALIEAGNSWNERQMRIENNSGAIGDEIGRRVALMREAYPFEVNDTGSLLHRPSKTGVYEFCLTVARNPTGVSDGVPNASAIFEMISRDVVALHLGTGTSSFRSGAPPYEFELRGNSARETFLELQKRCGEFKWNPDAGFPDDPTYKHLKDIGLDIVVWKPWPDGRLAQFFALAQCACGKNDVDSKKGRELSVKRLETWLRPVCHVDPVRCFLVAHHIPNTMQLYEISREAGLVFDRARIALIAEAFPEQIKPPENIDYHKMAKLYANPRAGQPTLSPRSQKAVVEPRSR